MATATNSAQILTLQLGLSIEDAKMRIRRLRQVGDLPWGGKGPTAPHLNVEQVITLFLSCVAGGPHHLADIAPRSLWQLVHARTSWEASTENGGPGSVGVDQMEPDFRWGTFGDGLVALVNQCRLASGRSDLMGRCRDLTVWADGSGAAITFGDANRSIRHWFLPVDDPARPAEHVALARVSRLTTIPFAAIPLLADLVVDGEMEARKPISRRALAEREKSEGAKARQSSAPSTTGPKATRVGVEQPHRDIADSATQERDASGSAGPVFPHLRLVEENDGRKTESRAITG